MSALREVAGDLFDPGWGLEALAHGVNCQGVMGAGIAVMFRDSLPAMYEEYKHRCQKELIQPGDIMTWASWKAPLVYNLATQNRPGADASLDAVRDSVRRMLLDAELRGIKRVGMPRIGCGIGGLKWDDVRLILAECATGSPVDILVVTLP